MFLARVPRPPVPFYSLHQVLWSYLPEHRRRDGEARSFVYRVERGGLVFLSRDRPLCDCLAVSPYLRMGQVYQFRLRCSPVRGAEYLDPETGRKVRWTKIYETNDERRAWLSRRLEGAATVLFCSVFDRPPLHFRKPGATVHWPECEITGTLRIDDRTALIQRMTTGVGGRGAWGHGLLYLPEVMGCAV